MPRVKHAPPCGRGFDSVTSKKGKAFCRTRNTTARKTRKDKGTRRDVGEQVGRRYGKTVYVSKRGANFYYTTNGRKVYLSKKAKENWHGETIY